MGYTSKQIDEELYMKDVELLIALDGEHTQKEIRKEAIAIGKAIAGDFK